MDLTKGDFTEAQCYAAWAVAAKGNTKSLACACKASNKVLYKN